MTKSLVFKNVKRWFPLLAFILLAAIYYFWSISGDLGSLGGDNAIYLLMAQYFSPGNGSSDVAAFFAAQSQYPPLYPVLLALFGGQQNLFIAHAITTSFLLLALLIYYAWQRHLGFSAAMAVCLSGVFALLPGTYMQALELLSENLYLLLTLSSLLAATRYEQDQRDLWLWVTTICVAGATLTRSVGITMLVAFVVYLSIKRPAGAWRYAVSAAIPMSAWALFGTHASSGYVMDFVRAYSVDPFGALKIQLSTQPQALWSGWVNNFTTTAIGAWVVIPLTLLGGMGLLYRLSSRHLDGYYVITYLALVLLWPYPAETARFVYVVQPIILTQAFLLLVRHPLFIRARSAHIHFSAVILLTIFIVALPDLALTWQRFMQPLPPTLESMRRSPYWYESDRMQALAGIHHLMYLRKHMESVHEQVPETDCVYSIKPSVVGFFAQRRVFAPPTMDANDSEFAEMLSAKKCRYFFLMNGTAPGFSESLYPLRRLSNNSQVVSLTRASKDGEMISALVQIPPP